MLLAVTPFPRPLTTPPLTRTYFILLICPVFWGALVTRAVTVSQEDRSQCSSFLLSNFDFEFAAL